MPSNSYGREKRFVTSAMEASDLIGPKHALSKPLHIDTVHVNSLTFKPNKE